MMNRRLAIGMLSCLLALPAAAQRMELKLCEDSEDWPPFMYYQRDAAGRPGTELAGSTVDVMAALFKRLKQPYRIELMPWKRCMAMVEQGQFHIGMDAYMDKERARRFHYSQPYYTLTPTIYFLSERFPQGLGIRSAADFRRWRGCGIQGYSYEHYGLSPADLDMGAKNHESVIAKLEAGRCDYFVEEHEVMAGFSRLGRHLLRSHGLGKEPAGWAKAPQLHLLVSKALPGAERLLQDINREINYLRQQGEVAKRVQYHLGTP